jgi:2-polyprenyl-3-methyl-5-hydroxy-6-metoxy-1,4-benzoquinol methylase
MNDENEVGLDHYAKVNQRRWEKCVRDGEGCTIPWLDLDLDMLRQFGAGDLDPLPEVLAARGFAEKFPADMLAGVRGKGVLCLGAGGGQQSAVFGLLGARVTVLDLAQGQLEGDRKAAEHYGYEVTTIHAHMRDLSALPDGSFDIVYATGLSYVPDIRQIYAGVAGVIRPGGTFRLDVNNPALQFVRWDGEAYRIAQPYCEVIEHREDDMFEFRHYVDDALGGLLDAGFTLRLVLDPARYRKPPANAPPGSWKHAEAYVGLVGWVVVATKDMKPLRKRTHGAAGRRER